MADVSDVGRRPDARREDHDDRVRFERWGRNRARPLIGFRLCGRDTRDESNGRGDWDAANGMQEIGDLPGGSFFSNATRVSADGSRAVGASNSASGTEAFIRDVTNGMQSLQVLLTSLGIDLTGWQLEYAIDISVDGNTITGYGTNSSGFTEGFVAVIPEPSTALLMGLGLVGLGSAGRRA